MSMHCYAVVDPSGALRIVLPLPTPSANAWSGRAWYKRSKLKKDWAVAIAAVVRIAEHRTMGRMHVHIERRAPRDLDPDNLVGGCKPLLDALVSLGLLVDDNPRWLDLTVTQCKPGKGEPAHSTITIERAATSSSQARTTPQNVSVATSEVQGPQNGSQGPS